MITCVYPAGTLLSGCESNIRLVHDRGRNYPRDDGDDISGAAMRYPDWGERSPRWAGIRSETLDLRGTPVHLLRKPAAPGAPPGAPVHLLIHPMAGSGTAWLDTVGPLSAYGTVIAPDLPGTLFGHTGSPRRNAARAEVNARFLRAFTSELGLERVVLHGWSMGGLVALLFTDLAPRRVERLVLAAPTLPGPMTAAERAWWQTLGRLALLAGPPIVRGLLSVLGPKALAVKLDALANPEAWVARGRDSTGGDILRLSPEMTALLTDQLKEARSRPRRLSGAVTAFASASSTMFVNRRPVETAIGRISPPTLLAWGDRDPVISRVVIDHLMTQRPDWDLHVFEGAGHVIPAAIPDAYAEAVAAWLTKHRTVGSRG
ncbi:hypothetical protein GCM10010156_47610 [Planobispora rosea]|uniref:AB hydrolase-1 domain-containing protein n=2 Tax=Planobispora rosea TaxID=35762 RepID=A0A8J3S3B5_PLARO|nr:hypothetical protein GCM10010156_47610 [Planobispora rosea]GIH86348.1 hypothetical protein Pro02_47560 [Planobispora rosea]